MEKTPIFAARIINQGCRLWHPTKIKRMKNEESQLAQTERFGLLQLAGAKGQNIVAQLTGDQLLFQILCFKDDADVVRYIRQEKPIAGTFVPGYKVALHLVGTLRTGGYVQPDESIEEIKRTRLAAVEWLMDQKEAWTKYIEPYASLEKLEFEGGAIDFATGVRYKAMEEVRL